MVYFPTFTIKNQPNVGKYTIPMDAMGMNMFLKVSKTSPCLPSSDAHAGLERHDGRSGAQLMGSNPPRREGG